MKPNDQNKGKGRRRMKYWIVSGWIGLLMVSALYGQPSHYGVEFQVNTCNANGFNWYPHIGVQPNGNFIVVYQCWDRENYNYDVYGQQFSFDGNKLGNEFLINDYTHKSQQSPAIAVQSNGDFIVVWQSEWQDGSGRGVYAQQFDSMGTKQGELEFRVNNTAEGNQGGSAIAVQPNGNFIIVWKSDGENLPIYLAQRFDQDGKEIGSEFQINTSNRNNEYIPTIAVQPNSNFIIAWAPRNGDGSGYGILAQRFDSEGNKLGREFQVNTNTISDQNCPRIATQPNGNFVITWQTVDQDGIYGGYYNGIYAQRFDSEGNKLGKEFKVDTYGNDPAITIQPNGNFIISWRCFLFDVHDDRIFAQCFNTDGNKLGSEFQVNSYSKGSQTDPFIATQPNGDFIVGWNSYGSNEYGGYGVYAKIFSAQPQVHPLISYSLINPIIDGMEQSCSPRFIWQKPSSLRISFPWEIEYHLYIDTLPDFTTARIITGIYDTCYVIDTLASAHTYFWKVAALNTAGDSLWSNQTDWGFFIPAGYTTGIGEAEIAAENREGIRLLPNRPNPFNHCTTLRFQAAGSDKAGTAALALYTITGRRVREWCIPLQNGCREYETVWNGCDESGMPMPSGIYLLRLECGSSAQSSSLLLLK
ncbi:MAG: hypothetical protein KBA26_10370 [Candidatus Delongbacteria bacterium]|nr:hypothetical protein [Candidatus Delongbacteria bacterium]